MFDSTHPTSKDLQKTLKSRCAKPVTSYPSTLKTRITAKGASDNSNISGIFLLFLLVVLHLKHPSITHYEDTYNAPIVPKSPSYKQD